MAIEVIASNLGSFAAGTTAGFFFARVLVRSEIRYMSSDDEKPPASHGHRGPTDSDPVLAAGRQAAPVPRYARIIVILCISIMLFIGGAYTGFKVLEHKYGCLDTYANDLYDSLTPRQAAAQTLQDKQQAVFSAIATLLTLTPESAQADKDEAVQNLSTALAEYDDAAKALETQRQDQPYPDPPREVC